MQIETIDLHFLEEESLIASYLLRSGDEVILVESGPGSTLPGLVEGLKQRGLTPADVTRVLLTHIHLDHAGASGWLAEQGANIYVHHVGAPHLLDPSRLWSSATRVYGEEWMLTLWGEMRPVPKAKLHILHDGDVLHFGDLTFTALDTPGHASHHMSYLIEGACFTGDVGGCAMPGTAHVRMPTPPPDIDLELWMQSLQKLRAAKPKRLYLTHFGIREEADGHLAQCEQALTELRTFLQKQVAQGLSKDEIVAAYFAWIEAQARAEGVDASGLKKLENVVSARSSVSGMLRYFRKRQEERA